MLYYQYNNHGDVISVLDQSGTVKNEYDGNAITEKETVSNPYRYAGYYKDSESGLYYLQSRYYNPRTARFLTEDTASGKYTDPLSLNKYTYCHNQPVTGYDPDGHFLHIVLGAAIGGVIGAASSLFAQRKEIGTGAYSYKKYWGSVAEGAITGGIAAATFGGSLAAGAAGTGVKTAAKFTVKEAAKKTVTNAVIGAGTGLAGNTANQFISKGVSNYDAAEAVASSTATAASFMGMGFMSGTASSAGSKAAQKVAGNAMKKAGAKAAGKAGTSILSKVMGAAVEGGILGSSSGFFANTASQITKVQAGEQDNYNPMSLATDTALGGIVGAGIGATLGAASAVDAAGKRSCSKSVLTQKHVRMPTLPEGSPWERNVLNSFAGGKATPTIYKGGTILYRVGGKNGGFWSLDPPPATEYQWRVEYAIKQEFCNDASTLYKMTIPEGSSLGALEGKVGTQGMGLYGGAHQAYIDFKAVPEDWIETAPTSWK